MGATAADGPDKAIVQPAIQKGTNPLRELALSNA